MAKNQVFDLGNLETLELTCSQPATPVSGDPVLSGVLPGVALANEDAITGKTVCALNGVWLISVKGADGSGNVAVSGGQKVYYDSAETGAKLNRDSTNGVPFGTTYGDPGATLVAAGAVATIPVIVGK